jgi:hypothetical protein
MASLLELEGLMKMHKWSWRSSPKNSYDYTVGQSTEKLIEDVAKYLRENGQELKVDSLFEQYKPK